MTLTPLGDQGLLIELREEVGEAAFAKVQQVADAVRRDPGPGVREIVPAFTTVGLSLSRGARLAEVNDHLRRLLAALPEEPPEVAGREREVPVCYGGDLGPDLAHVAAHAQMSPEEVVGLHSRAEYRVHAVGFVPGFPYLAGLPPRLHVPRRATPRTHVPAGSVAIGAAQCGIYPLETPGGWHVIGRTPHLLFEPRADPPAWLQPGDRVRFRRVTREEFDRFASGALEARRALLPGTHPPFEAEPVIGVLRPGIFTTVQDLGRHGWQAQGVPTGGALDPVSLRCVNLLVGNPPDAAGLEYVLRGPVLRFEADRLVALLGAAPPEIAVGRPFLVRGGETLDLTHLRRGLRGYLAVGGGINVPVVLGSRSTCLRGNFGGYRGRPLRAGDTLATGEPAVTRVRSGWTLAQAWLPRPTERVTVRVVRGPQAARFGDQGWDAFVASAFRVRPESDRMGLRLDGPALSLLEPGELVSAAVGTGAIQVPPDGRPIVLLADHQTLGGYPQIGYVVSADLSLLAQAGPGTELRFREVTLEEAEFLRREQERDLGLLALGVQEKLSRS